MSGLEFCLCFGGPCLSGWGVARGMEVRPCGLWVFVSLFAAISVGCLCEVVEKLCVWDERTGGQGRFIRTQPVGRGLFDVLHLHISNRKVGNQKCSLGVVHEDATKEFKSFISRAGSVEHSSFLVRT